ncbi:hypothetical protein T459_13945 [Capsicum annuum]|uniref:Calmodulin-binding domain-containing protein n=1 Tax=Capsicum annuum TaxID=4072 RepID=A0A2G2ZG17_CAPAN|nr:hypothetical protein T459_13945 [Capsicum annuum]
MRRTLSNEVRVEGKARIEDQEDISNDSRKEIPSSISSLTDIVDVVEDVEFENNDGVISEISNTTQSLIEDGEKNSLTEMSIQSSSSTNDTAMQENIAKKETEKECAKTPKLGRGFSLLLSMSDPKEENGSSKETSREDHNPRQHGRSFCRDDAVKLIREAVNEILTMPIQDDSSDTQSVTSEIISDQELSEAEGEVNNSSNSTEFLTNLDITEDGKMLYQDIKDPKEERELPLTTNKPKTQRSKNWSKLKKLILPRISIKALERARKFNPRAPQLLPATPNQEPEKVDLRHQMADERKKAEKWMLDYAMQNLVATLTPARKKKSGNACGSIRSSSSAPRSMNSTKYISTPTRRHQNGIRYMSLFYSKDCNPDLIGHADVGYSSNPHKSRSQTCNVFTCGDTAISWRYTKQSIIATSSNHAEIIVIHEASRE